MKNKYFFILLILIAMLYSCKKDNIAVNFHENYFPLSKGKFVEYDVTYIKHNSSTLHDTSYYVLKTLIGDTVYDNQGRVAWKFYRYIYNTTSQLYEIKDLWTAIIDGKRAELVEENQRIIKLIFAPTLSKEWDMNAFNVDDPLLAFYENIHKSVSINGLDFDSTITVIQERSDVTLIDYSLKTETYAANIGLISKYYKSIKISNFDTLNVNGGEELYYKIRNYGVE